MSHSKDAEYEAELYLKPLCGFLFTKKVDWGNVHAVGA